MLHTLDFVNTVNQMNDFLNPKYSNVLAPKVLQNGQFTEVGVYVREDDQDWGSAGMNDIQKDSE
jgi:hypothetical protein